VAAVKNAPEQRQKNIHYGRTGFDSKSGAQKFPETLREVGFSHPVLSGCFENTTLQSVRSLIRRIHNRYDYEIL
jgi:hypothetical protein